MAHRFNWSLGHEGKGNVYPNGDISTWNIDQDKNPHHDEKADAENQDFPTFYFYISPEGGISHGGLGFNNHSPYSDDEMVKRIVDEGAPLYDGRETWEDLTGEREEKPGGGYGHAYNLLEMMSKLGVREDGWADFHTELKIPRGIRRKIRQWVDRLNWPEGSEKSDARTYHITILSMDEYDEDFADWARAHIRGKVFSFKSIGMDIFADEHVVLRVECPEWTELVLHWQEKADREGLEPRKFDPPKAHITVGTSPEGKWPQGIPDPHLEFDTRMFNINKNSSGMESPEEAEFYHNAGMTRNKRLQLAEEVERESGPDRSEVVHTFPDGWTIRRPQYYGDLHREGELMGNCLSANFDPAPGDVWDEFNRDDMGDILPEGHPDRIPYHELYNEWVPDESGLHHSLRDPDNLPHLTFEVGPNSLNNMLGQHNTEPKYEYLQRVRDWLSQDPNYGHIDTYYDYGEPGEWLRPTPINEYWQYQDDWHNKAGQFAYMAKRSSEHETTPADELSKWLQSFPAQQESQPLSIHHTDESQIAPQTRSPVAEGPHIDPPSHPYKPYNWAEEGFEMSPLDRTQTEVTGGFEGGSVDPREWMHGQCAAWAVAHQRLHPELKFGIHYEEMPPHESEREAGENGEEWDGTPIYQPQHIFTHDDNYAYDAEGRHPMPYEDWSQSEFGLDYNDILGTGMLEYGWIPPAEQHIQANDPYGQEHTAAADVASSDICPHCGDEDGTPCKSCGYDELQLGSDYEQSKRHWYDQAWDEAGSPRPFPSQPEHWRHDHATDTKFASAPQVMYHVAPQSAREAIEQEGLRSADDQDGTTDPNGNWGDPSYVWMMDGRPEISPHNDVWEINAEGLYPEQENSEWGAPHNWYRVPHRVERERIRRLNDLDNAAGWHDSPERAS